MRGRVGPVGVSVAVATAALLLVRVGGAAAAPPAPVLQTDAPVTSDSPHVYWTPVAGADQYVVTRLAGCTSGTPLGAYKTANSWFDDVFIDLRRPARLGYVVQAHDASGWSASSSCVPVTYDPAPPQLFLGADAQPDGSISLHWTVNDFSEVTLVLRRGDPGAGPPASAAEGSPVCATPAVSTGCIDTAPVTGQRYDYSLFAIDAAGNPAATTASALALDTVPPAPPTGLVATPGDGQLSLAWAAPADPGVTGYRVVSKPGGVAPGTATDGTTACEVASVSCVAGGLADGTAVSLTVFARDAAGNWSIPGAGSSVTATPVAPPPPPPPPQLPQAPDRTPPAGDPRAGRDLGDGRDPALGEPTGPRPGPRGRRPQRRPPPERPERRQANAARHGHRGRASGRPRDALPPRPVRVRPRGQRVEADGGRRDRAAGLPLAGDGRRR